MLVLMMLISTAFWLASLVVSASPAHADTIGDEILARERCMAACDNDSDDLEPCHLRCPALSAGAVRRLAYRDRSRTGSRSTEAGRCASVTPAVVSADQVAASAGHQKFESFINRLKTAAPEERVIAGLSERQVAAIRASIIDSGPIARQYQRRIAEITAPEGSPRYLVQQRRAVLAYESSLRARIDQVAVPAGHALRRKLDKAFTAYRRTSYAYMKHAECTYGREVAGSAVTEEVAPTVEVPVIESPPGPVESESVIPAE